MKTRVLSVLPVLAMGVFLGFPVSGFAQGGNGRVTIEKACCGCIRLPGIAVSEPDQKALNAILSHADKSLYRIDTYKNGAKTQSLGKLRESFIGGSLTSEVAKNVESKNFSGWAIQIGECPKHVEGRHLIDIPGTIEHLYCVSVEDLIKKTEPILKKYSK